MVALNFLIITRTNFSEIPQQFLQETSRILSISLISAARNTPNVVSSRPELKCGVSLVRELHVYGSVVPVSARDPSKFQHRGFGTLLMEEAERIAKDEHGARKLAVISGA